MIGQSPSPLLDLITQAEKSVYQRWGFDIWGPADLYCTTSFLFPDIVTAKKEYYVTVELDGTDTRGQYVLDHKFQHRPNAIVQMHFDECLLKKYCIKMAALRSYKKKDGKPSPQKPSKGS